MKKLRKIWVLALLAAGFALVLGCSNGSSGSGSGSGGNGGGSTDGSGDGTGTGTGTGDQTVSGAKGKVIKGIGIGGDEGFTFEDVEIIGGWPGNYTYDVTPEEDGSIKLTAGGWAQFYITLPNPIDISDKKIAITANAAADYDQKYYPEKEGDEKGGLFKVIFYESDDNQSEVTANDEGNVGWCYPLSQEAKTYTANDIWKAYGKDAADLTNITQIIINPQSGEGDITIQSIKFLDKDDPPPVYAGGFLFHNLAATQNLGSADKLCTAYPQTVERLSTERRLDCPRFVELHSTKRGVSAHSLWRECPRFIARHETFLEWSDFLAAKDFKSALLNSA